MVAAKENDTDAADAVDSRTSSSWIGLACDLLHTAAKCPRIPQLWHCTLNAGQCFRNVDFPAGCENLVFGCCCCQWEEMAVAVVVVADVICTVIRQRILPMVWFVECDVWGCAICLRTLP